METLLLVYALKEIPFALPLTISMFTLVMRVIVYNIADFNKQEML